MHTICLYTPDKCSTLKLRSYIYFMPSPLLNAIVTCTARKTLPVSVTFGSLANFCHEERFNEWTRRLETTSSELKPAKELYAGSSWSAVREILAYARTNVWIASAGYGLITPETNIRSYSATFTRNHADFVGDNNTANCTQNWWLKLTQKNIPTSEVASVCQLVRRNPHIPLIAALSEDYWRALKHDFEEAAQFVKSRENMVIIAAGVSETGPLGGHFLPCSAKLERVLGRGRSSLNARILALIFREYRDQIGRPELFETFHQLLSNLDEYPYPQRRQTSDEQVAEFIRQKKSAHSKVSHSRLLREFRASGSACEQKRFRELFKQTHPVQVRA
jgi:hypothetical protein